MSLAFSVAMFRHGFAIALFFMLGCSGNVQSANITDAVPDGTSEASPSDTGADVAVDVGCPDCLSTDFSWGMDGGEVAYLDRSTLKGCNDYHRSRSGSTSLSCDTKLRPGCAGDLTDADILTGVDNVERALANADMQAALAKAPVLYGTDSRPVDGQVFQMIVGGKKIEIGGSCSGASGCVDAPAGVKAMQEVLQRIDSEKNLSVCSAFK